MSGNLRRIALAALLGTAVASAAAPVHGQAGADGVAWRAVDAAMGRSGSAMPGGVRRYAMPRGDLAVTSRGVRIRPALALGSWIAMKPAGVGRVVAMGDLVLAEDEMGPVISRLQQGGVGQTAIHKHLLDEQPAVWWTHVHAEGDPVAIAGAVRAALALTRTPAESPPAAAAPLELDSAAIRRDLGRTGRVSGGVYQVSVPRAETIRSRGVEVPPSMGTATVINFQPTGNGRAAIAGDFVMTADEVDPVIRALREHGIQVVSLHNHMTDESPRLFFMHFWANDDAAKLARGLRAALGRTRSAPAETR
ncbi:MAG TPA: DUF1259 domain-containing protein [Longimicrobium sp.]|nr:DUF1259 domain-containing protein [Longimicrobium sp.]